MENVDFPFSFCKVFTYDSVVCVYTCIYGKERGGERLHQKDMKS